MNFHFLLRFTDYLWADLTLGCVKFTFCPGGWVLLPGNRTPACPPRSLELPPGPGFELCPVRKRGLWILPGCSDGERLREGVTQRKKKDGSVRQKVVLRREPTATWIPQNTGQKVPESLSIWNLFFKDSSSVSILEQKASAP